MLLVVGTLHVAAQVANAYTGSFDAFRQIIRHEPWRQKSQHKVLQALMLFEAF